MGDELFRGEVPLTFVSIARLQTPLPALFPPHLLAVAAIYYASIVPWANCAPLHLPRQPHPWWLLFDVTLEEVRTACAWLCRLYDDGRGTASRVRGEWGGCVELAKKSDMRRWLDENENVEPGS